jgi:hypothetical protein
MSKINFIADVFAEQHLGGGELSNQELMNLLRKEGKEVEQVFSTQVTEDFLLENKEHKFIIGNFLGINEQAKKVLIKNCDYVIYEHDHKYLTSRDPSVYDNYEAPEDQVINKEFYAAAKTVFCQSELHRSVVQKNLKLDNIVSVGGNLWDDTTLELLRKMSKKDKADRYSIWDSSNPIKNTPLTVAYCTRKNIPFDLVGFMPYKEFLEKISENNTFIFLPQTLETLCRVAVECRMAGMKVITNKKIGASSEEWFKLKGEELIEYMATKKHQIRLRVEEALYET